MKSQFSNVKLALAFLLCLSCNYLYASIKPESLKIAFGSCSHQDKSLNILQNVIQEQPDVMLFLGDNIYGDTQDMQILRNKYAKLRANKNFAELIQNMPVHAIWDDHDFGENDAGKSYAKKQASKQIFLEFWNVPKEDKRWHINDGIYHSKWLKTTSGKSVHIIFPDLRFNRDELSAVTKLAYVNERKPNQRGPYKPDETQTKSMLGDNQWKWLEQELARPADVKILASSLQVLSDFTGWEAWKNYPYDIKKLFALIDKHKLKNILFISGDTHWTEISKDETPAGNVLYELTSSGLSEEWKEISPNKTRISKASHENNYGVIEISFNEEFVSVTMGSKNIKSEYLNRTSFNLLASH